MQIIHRNYVTIMTFAVLLPSQIRSITFFQSLGKNVKNIQLETRLSAKDFHYGC